METTNISSMIMQQLTQVSGGFNPPVAANNNFPVNIVGNDAAYTVSPNMMSGFSGFGSVMDAFAMFRDMVTTANDGVTEMKSHGESIRSLIEQAQEEGISDELLDKIQAEVDSRIAEINKIRSNTEFNGINPFDKVMSLDIPNWQDYITSPFAEKEEGEEGQMSEVLASFSFNFAVGSDSENGAFNFGATATVEIGVNEDGNLQINVDATMDFDLSEITQNGVRSDSAMDIINQFLSLLTGKQEGLNSVSNMFDQMFASGSASIQGDAFSIDATNDINVERSSSNSLKGQIVQHASITLDSTAYQCPNIAINLL